MDMSAIWSQGQDFGGGDAADWRTLQPDGARQRSVNKIMDTLKRRLPFSGEEGIQEHMKMAVRFEEKTCTAAASQSDYLRKISLEMLKLETESQNPPANSYPFNAASYNQNPQYPAAGDWRIQLPAESRRRIVDKIIMTLMRHLPFTGEDGMKELLKIAARFEEKTYSAATSQSDYLRKISFKMMTMETRSQNTTANSIQFNAAGNTSQSTHDPFWQGQSPESSGDWSVVVIKKR